MQEDCPQHRHRTVGGDQRLRAVALRRALEIYECYEREVPSPLQCTVASTDCGSPRCWGQLGGTMGFLSNINFEVILQLTVLAGIVIAGPAVIILIATERGNL